MISIITESTSYDNTADLIDNIMGTTAPRSAKTFEHIIICTEKNPDLEAFCAKAITMGYPCKIIDTPDFVSHVHSNTTIIGFIEDTIKILTSDFLEDIFDCDLFPAIVKFANIGMYHDYTGYTANGNGFYYFNEPPKRSSLKYNQYNLANSFILLTDYIKNNFVLTYTLLNTVVITK